MQTTNIPVAAIQNLLNQQVGANIPAETAVAIQNLLKQQAGANIPAETAVAMPRLMDQRDLANYLGKSTAWCERARWAGEGPRFIKLGRHVRYRADDVLAWIEANARTSTEEGC